MRLCFISIFNMTYFENRTCDYEFGEEQTPQSQAIKDQNDLHISENVILYDTYLNCNLK